MIGQLACLWLHGRSRKTTKASTDGMEGDSVKKVESILNEDIVSALYILQGLRKHFRIGQAMKKFFACSAHTFFITSSKASLWLADASWFLKLMMASFQFHYL